MTNEEAVEIIKFHIPRGAINAGVNIDIRKVADEIAFDMAIQALEKQIAIRPVGEYKVDKNKTKTKLCSECNWTLADYDMYCSNCGQKLDWS